MRVIQNLNLRNKLLLILFILFIPLFYFSINTLIIEREKAQSLKTAYDNLQETAKVTEVFYHIQRERALSQGYILMAGKTFGKRLNEQRLKTNNAFMDYQDYLQSINKVNFYSDDFSRLSQYRIQIDALEIDPVQFESFFSGLVDKFSESLATNNVSISELKTKQQVDAYLNFLQSKSYLAQIRTIAIRMISEGDDSGQELVSLSGKKSLFEVSQDIFLKNINNNILNYYQEKTNHESVARINNFLNNVLLRRDTELSGEDPIFWFDNFTIYIDLLKDVDNYALAQIENELLLKKNQAEQRLLLYILFVIFMLFLAIGLSIYIINSLLRTVALLKVAAEKVAEGDVSINIPHISNDEIGSLANSFKMVVNKNHHLATVSDEIGKGNYDIQVQVRNDKDMLARSLEMMKVNLKKLTEKDRKSNWILSGSSELNDLVSGDKNLKSVSEKLLNYICHYIQAEVGALYLMNDFNRLEFMASYAFSSQELNTKSFDPSEGVLGQVLKDQHIVRLSNVYLSNFVIKTGLTASGPAEVLLVPLYFQEQPVGVLEFATINNFSEEKLEFLEHIDERTALTILNLKADIKNAELLAETQTQAEELETQQEELRQSNMELMNQKLKLQDSEEELKANQEELEEKNMELEEKAKLLEEHFEAINNKNTELEDARQAIQLQIDELQRVGKYKSDFLANMSHELRTPLNSILILAKLIAENREGNLTSKQVEFADVIHNSGNDLLKLINEILDLTKIEAGKLSLEIKEFKLKKLNMESLFNEVAREKNIYFKVNYNENLPSEVVSDQFRIEQILKNLISNAFKFTEPGGKVSLDVFVPPPGNSYQNPTLLDSPEVIAFAIRDSGIGISEEDQKTIFDAFKQADSSITRKFGGTGLGLSICKELAQILGGELKVESVVGEGSCFTLFIPNQVEKIKEPALAPLNSPQVLKEQTGTRQIIKEAEKLIMSDEAKSILIIEDDKGFAKILADFAKGKKIEPVITHLGMKGLELAKQVRPSAILLDIQLPDISGWEVLEQLKEDHTTRYIPVHIMSAYDLNPASDDFSKENYLPKPVSLENLDKAFFKINSKNKNEVKKVLIIEDNKVESNAVKELLLAHELNSEIANSGEEAFSKLNTEKFDCIILDISLPGMGGYEILEKLKSDRKLKSIPVIVYSGKSFSEEEEFKLKKYVNAIVIKTDYSYKRLLDEVKLFLHKVQEKLPVQEQNKLYRTDQSLANIKVLIVDDDSRNTYSLYNAFEAESMNIVVATNGVEALKQLDEHPDIQIILMDIMMPEMDGLECTRRIRNMPVYAGLPIIALTAKAMKEDKEKCLEAGASDYVTKPVNIDKLLSLMRVWVNRNENIIML